MKCFKKLIAVIFIILTLGISSCGVEPNPTPTPTPTPTPGPVVVDNNKFTVTFNSNGGSSVTSLEVNKGAKLNISSEPTKEGYTFKGWYKDENLTTLWDATSDLVFSNITLYAKWEEKTNNNNDVVYGIVDRDKKIPCDTEFSSLSHESVYSTTIQASSFKGGNYANNFETGGKSYNGIFLSYYRYSKSGSQLVLHPDNSYFKNTSYHGIEGSLFNTSQLGGINEVEVSYKTTSTSSGNLIKPNVRFGEDYICDDFVYFLEPSSSNTTTKVNVNLSGFKFFSINSGDYDLYITSITLKYDAAPRDDFKYSAESGLDKVRINPYKYTGTLEPGVSKITVPTGYKYDESTNKYVATTTKELTYYTTDYVSSHPEVKQDATIIDPMEVCMYYTAFNTWPANYSKGNTSYVFGRDARKVSEYSRTDGYVRAVPWNFSGVYYELDIDLDGSYSTLSRGVGRVVVWANGWSADGYDNSPACIFTDDHYNTFMEYLNNGTWSHRFNAEGFITGIEYSTPTTVTLDSFDTKIVQGNSSSGGQQGGQQGGNTSGPDINASDYYANIVDTEIINSDTARFQKVTALSGLKEGSKYVIVAENFKSKYSECIMSEYFSEEFILDNDRHLLEFVNTSKKNYILEYAFEIEVVDSNHIYLKRDDTYYSIIKEKEFGPAKNLMAVSFDNNGDFHLSYNGFEIRFNDTGNGLFRPYKPGSLNPIQLYRYCDVIETSRDKKESKFSFELTNLVNVKEKEPYMIISTLGDNCLTDRSFSKYEKVGNGLLIEDENALYDYIFFEKNEKIDNVFAIYKIVNGKKSYFHVDSEIEFQSLKFSNEKSWFKIVEYFDGYYIQYWDIDNDFAAHPKFKGEYINVYLDNYDENLSLNDYSYSASCFKYAKYYNGIFIFKVNDSEFEYNVDESGYFSIVKNVGDINTKDEYIIVAGNDCLTAITGTYNVDFDKNLSLEDAKYYKIKFEDAYIENRNIFYIYLIHENLKLYLTIDEDNKLVFNHEEESKMMFDLAINSYCEFTAWLQHIVEGTISSFYVETEEGGNFIRLNYTDNQFRYDGKTQYPMYLFKVIE